MENNVIEREFSWDEEIVKESGEFTLLPEGDYDFTVNSFDRARHAGSEKLPPCNKAILHLTIEGPEGDVVQMDHSLFLHSKTEGMLGQFFLAIGQKKHGEPLKMNWNLVPGAKGKCRIFIDEYTKKDGSVGKSNKIKRFLDPAEKPATPTSTVVSSGPVTFTPGAF